MFFEVCLSHSAGYKAGCFLFLVQTLPVSKLGLPTDQSDRFSSCDFVLYNMEWCVVHVYASNNNLDRSAFFREL